MIGLDYNLCQKEDRMKIAILFVLSLALVGCMGYNHTSSQNGIARGSVSGFVSPFYMSSHSERFDQRLPVCEADIGRMDGDEQHHICLEQVRGDARRREAVLDAQTYGYYPHYSPGYYSPEYYPQHRHPRRYIQPRVRIVYSPAY